MLFYQQTDGIAIGRPASSTTAEIYMQAYEQTAISAAPHPPKVLERFVDDFYSMLWRTAWKTYALAKLRHINNLLVDISLLLKNKVIEN